MTDRPEHRPLRIGLTGGIASGKSIVAAMFADLGAQIIDTDVIAREVVEPGRPALDELRQRFGDEVFSSDGRLDRAALRRIVFSDPDARRDLELILHPRIGREVIEQARKVTGPYQIVVVPLLVGSPLLQFVDRVLVVDCDEQVQLNRLVARDSESTEQAERIIASQSARDQRLSIADDVIDNSGDLLSTAEAVRALDVQYRACRAP